MHFGAATASAYVALTYKRSVALRVGVVVGGIPELVVAAGADGIARKSSGESETQAFSLSSITHQLGNRILFWYTEHRCRTEFEFRQTE